MEKKENALVVVALDFGTTYSGYAFSFRDEYKKDHTKIYSNENWQSGDGLVTPKTPTAILFENGTFHSFGYDAELAYSEILEGGDTEGYSYFSKFKMKLFQSEENLYDSFNPRQLRKLKIGMELTLMDDNGNEMQAITVFSESIRFFKDHFTEAVRKMGNFSLNNDDVHWVLTVPAIWKDNAKQFMREAAKQAGIPPDLLTLAYEPEAAAICCKELTVQRKEDTEGCSLESFDLGQHILVLDCGGGTVDVTCYEIQNDSQLKELDCPTGGPWGGTYVDQEYMSFLESVFGEDVWRTYKEECPEDVLEIKRKFEAKKRGLKVSSKIKTTIPYPPTLFRTYCSLRSCESIEEDLQKSLFGKTVTFKGGKLRYEPGIIQQFFTKSLDSIIAHIRGLLMSAGSHIRSILMVGGFSESPILYERVKAEFPDFEVMRPKEAVTAVVKGAVMFGHNPELISERICPRTYGVSVNIAYNDKKHPEVLKCLVEGRYVCTDVFKIIATKGEPLIAGKTIKYVTCYPTRSTDTEANVELYESLENLPMYTIDKGVNRLGTLTVPIPNTSAGKNRRIKIELHFGYTELLVSASEEGTNRKVEAKFKCFSK